MKHTVLLAAACLTTMIACKNEPACDPGELPSEWSKAPLADQVPQGERTICAGASATEAKFWVDGRVHDANMASVDRAQSNGWSRTRDNWYDTKGNFDTPKWSEFANAQGKLRVDVHEANGGAFIEVKYTPKE